MLEKATLRILLLDDEPFMLKLLGHVQPILGRSCDNGRAALADAGSACKDGCCSDGAHWHNMQNAPTTAPTSINYAYP